MIAEGEGIFKTDDTIPTKEVMLRIQTRRVFLLRIWFGMTLIRLGLKIMGAKAEAA